MRDGNLADRVARLEREARRWRLMAGVLAAAGGVLAMAGAAQDDVPDTLRARNIHVVNAKGDAVISMWESGGAPSIRLHTPDARKMRLSLMVGKDSVPGLLMTDPAGRPRLRLTIDPDGPVLQMYDEDHRTVARVPAGGR